MKTIGRHAGAIAALMFAAASIAFAAGLQGYSHRLHPLALLGGQGVPHAVAFDFCGFVVPGLLAMWTGWRLREGVAATSAWSRIGGWLVSISALAFAAQGLLPLDPRDLDAHASRLHEVSWMLWWIAFVPGAFLIAWGLSRTSGRRGFAWACALAAMLVLVFAMFAPDSIPAAVAQRIAFACWFAWLVLAGYATGPVSRGAA